MRIELAELTRALDNDEIIPYFQPIVELRSGHLVGFEVLARWQHPTLGPSLPPNLITLAESSGLIGIISNRVFGKAFNALAQLPGDLRLSLNLSPVQLTHLSLARQISELSTAAGIAPSRLTIEITESALLTNLERAQAVAGELKELGCHLSLDDFGTGYSSLAHLQALPFNELKIDRSFVSKMTKKRESRKIVAATIGLAHSLGMTTVAEGIENEQHADMLLWLGSEFGQGYYFGRPSPMEAASQILTQPPRPAALGISNPGDDWSVSSLEAFPTQRLAQLQAIYDGAPVGLCFVDCNQRYVSLNQKLAEMNGSPVAAHLGNTIKQMVPALYPVVEPYIVRALSAEAISGVEVKQPSTSPSAPSWLRLSYQPAFDEADEVIGVSIAVMDVTEQKLAQQALQDNAVIQHQIDELHGQTPWIMDPLGNDLKPSSEWVKSVPAGKNIVRNLGWLEAVHLDDLKLTIKKMKRALSTGESIDMEYRVQDVDGEWRWMRSRGSPRLGPNREITRWYGSVEDIHDQKVAALEIRRQESRLRMMLRGDPAAVFDVDGHKNAVWLTDASEPAPSSPTAPAHVVALLQIEQMSGSAEEPARRLTIDPPPRKPRKPASTATHLH